MKKKILLAEEFEFSVDLTAEIRGTICGQEIAAAPDTPAGHRWIDGMEVVVRGVDITDALPLYVLSDIEDEILKEDGEEYNE